MYLFVELTQIRLSDHSGGETDTLGPLPSDMNNGQMWSSSDDQISLPTIEGSFRPMIVHSHSNSPGKNVLSIVMCFNLAV